MHQNQYIADKIDSRSEMPAKPIITPENLQEVGHGKKKLSFSPLPPPFLTFSFSLARTRSSCKKTVFDIK
jgi:hypothetical protein